MFLLFLNFVQLEQLQKNQAHWACTLLVTGPFGAVSLCDLKSSSCQCSFFCTYILTHLHFPKPTSASVCVKNYELAVFGVSDIFHKHAVSQKNKKDAKMMSKLPLQS